MSLGSIRKGVQSIAWPPHTNEATIVSRETETNPGKNDTRNLARGNQIRNGGMLFPNRCSLFHRDQRARGKLYTTGCLCARRRDCNTKSGRKHFRNGRDILGECVHSNAWPTPSTSYTHRTENLGWPCLAPQLGAQRHRQRLDVEGVQLQHDALQRGVGDQQLDQVVAQPRWLVGWPRQSTSPTCK